MLVSQQPSLASLIPVPALPVNKVNEFYTNPKEVSESVQTQYKLCVCPPGKKPLVIQGRIGVPSNFVKHMKVSLIAILVKIAIQSCNLCKHVLCVLV